MNNKTFTKIITICAILFFVAFLILFFHGKYPQRIVSFFKDESSETSTPPQHFSDKALSGWERCLEQLNVDVDIVFIGDSITYQSDFTKYFSNKSICNLGIGSDTINDVHNRISMIKSVTPEKIFILCGINSLNNDNIDQCFADYKSLISEISKESNAKLYCESVLPISKDKSAELNLKKESIIDFNSRLRSYCEQQGITYIDIYSKMEKDGYIIPEFTSDGIHLTQAAYDIFAESIRPHIEN